MSDLITVEIFPMPELSCHNEAVRSTNYFRRSRRARALRKRRNKRILPAKKGRFTSSWIGQPGLSENRINLYRVYNPSEYWTLDEHVWDTFIPDTRNYDNHDWDYAALPPALNDFYFSDVAFDTSIDFNCSFPVKRDFTPSMDWDDISTDFSDFANFVPHSAIGASDFKKDTKNWKRNVYHHELSFQELPDPKTYSRTSYTKKRPPKKVEKKKSHFVPHAGLTGLQDTMKSLCGDNDMVWKRIEDLLLTITKLSLMTDYRLVLLEIITYLKTFSDKSISESAISYVVHIFNEGRDARFRKEVADFLSDSFDSFPSDEDDPYLCEDPLYMENDKHLVFEAEGGIDDFMSALRGISDNFNLVKNHHVFKKISYILSACVTLGLCEASSVTWSVQGIKLLSPELLRKHVHATDIISAVMETVIYFVEGGREWFTSGSFGNFLYSDVRIKKLQDDYNFVKSNFHHVVTGNLQLIAGIPDAEYSAKLDQVIIDVRNLKSLCEPNEKTLLIIMETKLHDMRSEFRTIRNSGTIRKAPFVVCCYGSSGQGKSVLQERIMVDLHVALGLDPHPRNFAWLSQYDKYDTALKGHTTGWLLDEVGNTKVEYQEKIAFEPLMRGANNAVDTAVMAEVEMKGQIALNPAVIIITTNNEMLTADSVSVEPVAILRRNDLYLKTTAKKEFWREGTCMMDAAKVYAKYGDVNPYRIRDVWEFDCYYFAGEKHPIEGRPEVPKKVMFKRPDGSEMKGVSYAEMIKKAIDLAREKDFAQQRLVENSGKYYKCVKLCQECNYLRSICQCQNADIMRQQWDKEFVTEGGIAKTCATWLFSTWYDKCSNWWTEVICDWAWHCAVCISPRTYEIKLMRDYEMAVGTAWKRLYLTCAVMLAIICITNLNFFGALCIFYALAMYKLDCDIKSAYSTFVNEHRKKDCIIQLVHRLKKRRLELFLAGAASLVVLYTVVKQIRKLWKVSELIRPHGNLAPACHQDILDRDKEKSMWQKPVINPVPTMCRQLDTATPADTCNAIFRNMVSLYVPNGFSNRYCAALVVDSNLILVPKHMIYKNGSITTEKLTFRRHGENDAGGVFSAYIDHINCHLFPDQDLALLSIPSAGSFRNIDRLLPRGSYTGSCMFVHKAKDGTRRQEGAQVRAARVGHTEAQFEGLETNLENPTYMGLCMGTFVTTDKAPRIAGFHLGGTLEKTTLGVAGYITLDQYIEAKTALGSRVMIPHSAGDFPKEILGKPSLLSTIVHDKSPVNFLENSKCMSVYGTCLGGVTFTSRVVVSVISALVQQYTGQANIWGPPPSRPAWKPWWETLDKLTHGSDGFVPADVDWAVKDYSKPLFELVRDPTKPYIKAMIRPLEPHEVINGVPGERFIDKMCFTSSIGYPLTGAKTNFLVDDVPREGYDNPQTFVPEIWSEIKRCEDAWAEGVRAYAPIKAVLKDEPTKVTKEKMRVFYSMNIGVQYHLRRLSLGLTRFFQTHTLVSESMVGMSAMSPEWDQWVKYCREGPFGEDLELEMPELIDTPDEDDDDDDEPFKPIWPKKRNTVACDYKSYDTKMPAQVILASLKLYKDLLIESGNFTERDIKVFEGICTEIVYPFMAYNGTLVELTSGHVSGNNLTVHVNNTCNSLLKRIAFLNIELKPRNRFDITFRECERGGNYGDDCKSSVNLKMVQFWNMRAFQQFLRIYGMEITMPDKESEMVDFMEWDSAEFLKRTDAYIPEIDCIVGKLDEMSIFKSLHSNLKSDVLSPTDHAIACINGACFEWFAYGREHYEMRMEQMKQVCAAACIRAEGVYVTFDQRVEAWLLEHRPESVKITSCGSN